MKSLPILAVAMAIAAPLAAQAANRHAADTRPLLIEERHVYVPVDAKGHVASNEMIVVEERDRVPANVRSAWRDADGSTYVLLPDPEDSKTAVTPRFHLVRVPRTG